MVVDHHRPRADDGGRVVVLVALEVRGEEEVESRVHGASSSSSEGAVVHFRVPPVVRVDVGLVALVERLGAGVVRVDVDDEVVLGGHRSPFVSRCIVSYRCVPRRGFMSFFFIPFFKDDIRT